MAVVRFSAPSQDSGSVHDYITAEIKVYRPSASPGAAWSPLAYIESISLWTSFADVDATESIPFDALRAVVDSPLIRHLRFETWDSESQEYKTMKSILCSVLRRTQLTWALESGKLQFRSSIYPVTSTDILSVPAEHTIDGTTITLDITEQAKWLLCGCLSRDPWKPPVPAREKYLRKLIAARASGASVNASSETEPSIAEGVHGAAAVGQTQHVAGVDGQGEEEDPEADKGADEESAGTGGAEGNEGAGTESRRARSTGVGSRGRHSCWAGERASRR